MLKIIRNTILILLVLIFLHDNGFLPLPLHWYQSQIKEHASFIDVQNGALAGASDFRLVFNYRHREQKIIGSGSRTIELLETEPLNSSSGGWLPFHKKSMPKVVFECFDRSNDKRLGTICGQDIFRAKGALSRPDFHELIYSQYERRIIKELSEKSTYIDLDPSSLGTGPWKARQTTSIDLSETGESIAPERIVSLKKGQNYSRDSLLFSTHEGSRDEYHHEIIISDRKKEELIVRRYYNNGQLALEAVFKPPIEIVASTTFADPGDKWRTNGTTDLVSYCRFDTTGNPVPAPTEQNIGSITLRLREEDSLRKCD